MVEETLGDLIKKGIIKEYIPQGAVTKLKAKPPTRVLQEIFPDVFQAWIDCDTEKHRLQTETGARAKGKRC